MNHISPRQQEVYDTYIDCEHNVRETSRRLNLNETTVKKTLFRCAKNGMNVAPDNFIPQAPAGFGLDGCSILTDRKGEVILRWDKVSPLSQGIEQFLKLLRDRTPVLSKPIKPPKRPNKKLCLEWLLYDHHHGLHAWAKQTGADYDIKISTELITKAAQKIYSTSGPVAESVIIMGGDNLHADNRSATTEKSGHSLDVDGRYQKTLQTMYLASVAAIDCAAAHSGTVKVIVLSGNHDYHSSIALSCILAAHYKNHKRILIDDSAAKHRFYRWGANYFMATHGDTGGKRLAGYMLQHLVQNDITGVRRMFVRQGHLHKRGKVVTPDMTEIDGVLVETFPTLVAPDAFAAEQAYISQRATVANLWHHKHGQRSRLELSAAELLE